MSVAVEKSEPFSEIEREVNKLERLLHYKTTEVEIVQQTVDIARASEPISQFAVQRSGGRSRVMSVVKALSRANQPPARRRAARSTNKREVSMRKLVVLGGGRRCSADA